MDKLRTMTIVSTTLDVRDDEYVKDGVIYCKRCRTARSVNLDGITVRCKCLCESADIEARHRAAREEAERIDNELRIKRLTHLSLLGDRYKACRFSTTDVDRDKSFVKALERCRRYCENVRQVRAKGYGMYLVGKPGVGKTHLVACMINELIERGYPAIITNLQTMINAKIHDEEAYRQALDMPFMFIDDIGTERTRKEGENTWAQDVLYEVVNSRYVAGLPTVFTSNYEIGELLKRGVDRKTVERIYEMSHAVIEIGGTSYRMQNGKSLPY